MMPRVTVLMSTYNQGHFIRRAIDSLCAQSLCEWELMIIDDGSTDTTYDMVHPYLSDARIQYIKSENNLGLGAALNLGNQYALSRLIAYLPADDVYYRDHLEALVALLEEHPEAVLAYSGVRHHYNRSAAGQIPGYSLQLVQVIHRQKGERWLEREELVTDDLERMYWSKFRERGEWLETGRVTCEWVDHPDQRHKLLREPVGGINLYRQHFNIQHPLRFHSSTGNLIDEVEQYKDFRERPATPMAANGLKILLVGELAYNADRVLALEEQGHQLYGLWMRNPYWYNTVGPLPFGHVQDLPYESWQQAVQAVQPDVIYALLNWQAVPFAHEVMLQTPEIPFVWHFKEGPFICMEKGTWRELLDLYEYSSGNIYISQEMKDWFETILPGVTNDHPSLILDGDLPKRDWLQGERSPRLSEKDGEIHTVVPGRPIGLHPADVVELAENGIHLHFYGNFTQSQWMEWIDKTQKLAPGHIHLHNTVHQDQWVSEFSQYDAGWLHYFKSENQGDVRRANWDDLNIPARISTLAAAGLPLLQRENCGAVVATQTLIRQMDIGLFFDNMTELREQLNDRQRMGEIRENVWRQREFFTFDAHVGELVQFFRTAIAHHPHTIAARPAVFDTLQIPTGSVMGKSDATQSHIL